MFDHPMYYEIHCACYTEIRCVCLLFVNWTESWLPIGKWQRSSFRILFDVGLKETFLNHSFFFFSSSSEIAFHEWHIWWQLNLDQAVSPSCATLSLYWSPILASFPSLIPVAASTLSSSSIWLDQYTNRREAHASLPVFISSSLRTSCWAPRRRLLLSSSCIRVYWDRRQHRLCIISAISRLFCFPTRHPRIPSTWHKI